MKKAGFILTMFLLAACGGNNTNGIDESTTQKNPYEEGKQLFHSRCASCHMVNKELTGPALRGVESRWPDTAKLHAFIRNSQAVIQEDKYARELWMQFNQTIMTPQPDLTDDQIRQILGYINSVSEKP